MIDLDHSDAAADWIKPRRPLLSDEELATLPDERLVGLIMERAGEQLRASAHEMLTIIRDEIPDDITI